MEIREVMDLLGHNEKVRRKYYLIICLFSRPWYAVCRFSVRFGQFSLSGHNCCFIRQKLPMEIRGVTTLLGSNGKMTADYKFIQMLD